MSSNIDVFVDQRRSSSEHGRVLRRKEGIGADGREPKLHHGAQWGLWTVDRQLEVASRRTLTANLLRSKPGALSWYETSSGTPVFNIQTMSKYSTHPARDPSSTLPLAPKISASLRDYPRCFH